MIRHFPFRAALALLLLAGPGATHAADNGTPAYEAQLRAGIGRLDFLKGDWSLVQSNMTAKGEWRAKEPKSISFAPTMNGLYIETAFAAGGNYNYRFVFSYDAAADVYRILSRDDQSGLVDVYEGNFDSSGALVVSNLRPGTFYAYNGVRYHNRMTFRPGPGGWEWLVDVSADEGATWRPQVKAVAGR